MGDICFESRDTKASHDFTCRRHITKLGKEKEIRALIAIDNDRIICILAFWNRLSPRPVLQGFYQEDKRVFSTKTFIYSSCNLHTTQYFNVTGPDRLFTFIKKHASVSLYKTILLVRTIRR